MRILSFAWCLALAACTHEGLPPLVASDVVVTEALPGQMMSAGYLSLTNNSDDAIRISSVSSPHYESIELHESSIENGVAKMRAFEELVIAPGSTVQLERGGMHLMLMRSNDSETVSLNFYQDATLLLSLTTPVTRRNN